LSDCLLHVLEVDIAPTNVGLPAGPEGIPPINGVVICYDSSDQLSFQPVENLLRMWFFFLLVTLAYATH
jgi:hypothetical protein